MITVGITVTNVTTEIQYSRITIIINIINKTNTKKKVNKSYSRIMQQVE